MALPRINLAKLRYYLPFAPLWLWDEETRVEQDEARRLKKRVGRIVQRAEAAGVSANITKPIPKSRSRTGQAYEDKLILGPAFATSSEAVLYVAHIPQNKYIKDVKSDMFREEFQRIVGKSLYYRETPGRTGQHWLAVPLDGGGELPRYVRYREALAFLQRLRETEPELHPMTFTPGLGVDKKFNTMTLENDFTNLLIGGSPGSGKTMGAINLLLQLCAVLAPPNETERYGGQLQVLLGDLKGEFRPLRLAALPHCIAPVATTPEAVLAMYSAVLAMMRKRQELCDAADRVGVDDYNRDRPLNETIPHLIVMVDEIATLTLRKEYGERTVALMAELFKDCRAYNIHNIIMTQRPEVKVVPGLIRDMCTVIAYRCRSKEQSRMLTKGNEAYDLKRVAGRCVYDDGLDWVLVQTPIPVNDRKRLFTEIVKEVKRIETHWGKQQLADWHPDLLPGGFLWRAEKIIEYVLEHDDWQDEPGRWIMHVKAIQDKFGSTEGFDGKVKTGRFLQQLETRWFEFAGTRYYVIPADKPKPRYLVTEAYYLQMQLAATETVKAVEPAPREMPETPPVEVEENEAVETAPAEVVAAAPEPVEEPNPYLADVLERLKEREYHTCETCRHYTGEDYCPHDYVVDGDCANWESSG